MCCDVPRLLTKFAGCEGKIYSTLFACLMYSGRSIVYSLCQRCAVEKPVRVALRSRWRTVKNVYF